MRNFYFFYKFNFRYGLRELLQIEVFILDLNFELLLLLTITANDFIIISHVRIRNKNSKQIFQNKSESIFKKYLFVFQCILRFLA